MLKELAIVKNHIQTQIRFIQKSHLDLTDKIILTRSLLENYAIYNFLKSSHTEPRIELFKCFGDFEWFSHQIYYSKPKNQRVEKFRSFLIKIRHQYPYGYRKYARLIKRRLCKHLRCLIKRSSNSRYQKELSVINSDHPELHRQQIDLLAKFMSQHLITKLPFPYRIIFGKSITFFVLKYSPINRHTYWLLADLSHGTLIENHLQNKSLLKLIKKLAMIINLRLRN